MIISFTDLQKEYLFLKRDIDFAIEKVLKKGNFILGEEVEAFEYEWANYLGVAHAVSVASGTDALFLSLKALGVGPGDEVILPTFTFISSALAISHVGAIPVFVDVSENNFLIDPLDIEKKITKKTKAIIAVHLYGFSADVQKINKIAKIHKLYVIEDAAQAHGAMFENKKIGSIGEIGCFSFYPTKNLGAYGDGGVIVTSNNTLAKKIIILRNYGQIKKYVSITDGYNSRLDELQAAILRVKLKYLDQWNKRRREIAEMYDSKLSPEVKRIEINNNSLPVYHIYPIFVSKRDILMKGLANKGISTIIHYPIPVHHQNVYKNYYKKEKFPVSLEAAKTELSLPIHPFLSNLEIDHVIDCVNSLIRSSYKSGKNIKLETAIHPKEIYRT